MTVYHALLVIAGLAACALLLYLILDQDDF